MVAMASRRNPLFKSLPLYLTWRSLRYRTICSGRLGFASTSPSISEELPVPGTKVLETFKEEFEVGSRLITFETGKMARFANGAVVMAMDETRVLSTVASSKGNGAHDFLPLTDIGGLEMDFINPDLRALLNVEWDPVPRWLSYLSHATTHPSWERVGCCFVPFSQGRDLHTSTV